VYVCMGGWDAGGKLHMHELAHLMRTKHLR